MKKLIITLDVDNDFIREPLEKEQSLQWDGLKVGMPEILLAIDGLALRLNTQIAVTIFCRADWQIEAVMGEVSWVFKKTQDVLKSLDLKNIQIGLEWHPHLYEKQNGKWALSVNKYAQEKQLLDIYAKLNNAGFDVKCSRIGECFFSPTILKTLNAIGIIFDSTAFSGRDIGHTNWTNTPTYPYKPSLEDFTTHGDSKLFEIPFTMIPIKAPYDHIKTLRYLNLIFDTFFTKEGIKNHHGPAIVTILHPYEILTLGNENTHQLFGNISSITENIKLIYQHQPIQSILLRDYDEN
jgi:hypothetical protein